MTESARAGARPTGGIAAPAAITLAGFALTLHLFAPGIMTYDARYIRQDSLNGAYGDWQSPVMTWIWRLIDPAAPGACSMFLLIVITFWSAILLLSLALARRSLISGLAVCGLAFAPPVLSFVGIIWRDIWMASAWLLAAAAVYACRDAGRAPRALGRGLALVLALLGFLLRPNALAAAPLLLAYIAWPSAVRLKRIALLFLPAMIALFALMQLIYYGALDAKRQHPLHSVLIFDLGGITHFAQSNVFPVRWPPEQQAALLTDCYDASIWNVYWNGRCQFVMNRIEHQEKLFGTAAIGRAWLAAVTTHPIAYLQHRSAFFWQFLAGKNPGLWTEDIARPGQRIFAERTAFSALVTIHDALQSTPLFRIGFWGLVNVAACLLVWRRRGTPDGAFVLGVSGSAILYLLSFWPLGVAAEFRYGYWAVLAGTAGLIVALQGRYWVRETLSGARVTSCRD